MPKEPEGNLISLLDEEGNEQEFEHLATEEYQGETYVALSPAYDDPENALESDGQLVILKIERDETTGEDILATLEDGEFDDVSKLFEKVLGDDYDFNSEDDDEDTETPD